MSMSVIVTHNAPSRVRGFLASIMLEVSYGVYCGPRISPSVRARIWAVMEDWFRSEDGASVVMIWSETSTPGGQSVRTLGTPPISMVEVDGLVLAQRGR